MACGLLTRLAMRIVLCFFVTLYGCTPYAGDVCAGVALGTPIGNVWGAASKPDSFDSWCVTHPQRDPLGPVTELRCCMRGTSDQCHTDCSKHGGAQIFSVGPPQQEYSDSAQCCAVVQDGKVAARYVGYD